MTIAYIVVAAGVVFKLKVTGPDEDEAAILAGRHS